tara:strand:- start:4865 stop:5446 length:582 start_codon:yes stop_codon:yes gene_type:complete
MCARYDSNWIESLLDPKSRFVNTSVNEILHDLGLGLGSTIVDYGCGPGLFTFEASLIVGDRGKVYSLDIEPSMVNLVKNKATSGNVSALRIQGDQSPLPDNVADVVLCILVMHYKETTDDRYRLVTDISRITKPGGRIFIVQWDTSEQNGPGHGISYEETLALLSGHNLQVQQKETFAEGQYSVLSTKLIDPN